MDELSFSEELARSREEFKKELVIHFDDNGELLPYVYVGRTSHLLSEMYLADDKFFLPFNIVSLLEKGLVPSGGALDALIVVSMFETMAENPDVSARFYRDLGPIAAQRYSGWRNQKVL